LVKRVIVGAAIAAAVSVVGASAQDAPQDRAPQPSPVQTPGERAQQVQARFQIAAMEAVLERAVLLGAQKVRGRVQAIAPDALFVNGSARARGFWLDGYGVFFDVDVPPMRRSLAWTARMLDLNNANEDDDLRELKQKLVLVADPSMRKQMLALIEQMERERVPPAAPLPAQAAAGAATRVSASGAPMPAPQGPPHVPAALEDPGQIYTYEVKDALVNAMIDYGTPIPLLPGDYLTVAARDQEGMHLQASDPYEVSTIFLRVKGADLAAYRAGQINLAEVRKRVEVKEY
jgi:hypothetical protein